MAKAKTPSKSAKSIAASTAPSDERNWRARDALSTLTRAEEIRADPKLMRDVQACAKKEQAALSRVTKVKA